MVSEERNCGLTPDGKQVILFTLTNKSGAKVVLSNIGAGIVSVIVPDRNGNMADVALGYKDMLSYINDGPCMGKIPGRYANRIAGGHFSLEGKEYTLAINNGPNHLHGGPEAQCFANRVWYGIRNVNEISFALESHDGDAGYPANLMVEATYTWSEDNVLTLKIRAQSDGATIVNLTNHAYFNLKGESVGDIKDHKLKLYASNYLPTDSTLIPSGELAPVAGTPMDFITGELIGKHLHDDFPALNYGKGYDNCWAVDDYKRGLVQRVAELSEETSGRRMVVRTNAPGIQVYTGNWLDGSPESKSGAMYKDYDGVALECQAFPDSPNKAQFPFQPLYMGEIYENTIQFAFDILS
ncbi:MAG: galactose mutarotase [Bacteroidales bacterium]|nr:galactose mutarotase [Bacteroidales bacterium]MDD3200640.1 galactose mutarotase [Bacteroidales bacterium]